MLTALTCRDVYPTTATNVDVLVTFQAPEEAVATKKRRGAAPAPAPATATPTYLACVLDVSGSMSGQKLSELTQTMLYITSTLGPNDHLSIVAFNDSATTLLPMTNAGSPGFLGKANSVIRALAAGGGTCISAGLTGGMDTLAALADPRSSKAILLLTDGQDSYGGGGAHWGGGSAWGFPQAAPAPPPPAQLRAPSRQQHRPVSASTSSSAAVAPPAPLAPAVGSEYPRFTALLDRAAAHSIALHTFGFGADHDAALMRHLAERGRGLFSFIAAPEDIAASFASALATLKSMVTNDLVVELAACAATPGAKLLAAHTAYPTSTPPGLLLRVAFGALAAGERRSLRATLALPPGAAQPLLTATAAYTALATGARVAPAPHVVHITRLGGKGAAARLAQAVVSVEVSAARARDEATAALSAALAHAEAGRIKQAQALLSAQLAALAACPAGAAGHPLVAGLQADLSAMASSVQHRATRADMAQAISGHRRQQFAMGSKQARAQLAYRVPQQLRAVTAAAQVMRQGASGGGGGGKAGGKAAAAALSGSKRRR